MILAAKETNSSYVYFLKASYFYFFQDEAWHGVPIRGVAIIVKIYKLKAKCST